MSTADKIEATFFFFFLYIVFGVMTGFLLDEVLGVMPLADDGPVADYIAVIIFWPLFAIKYLAIGIWLVVSSGFNLLIGA